MNIRILIIFVFILLLLLILIDGVNGKVKDYRNAQEGKKVLTEEVNSLSKAIEFGNRVCPVSGLKIPVGKEVQYEYEGKIYNFFSTSGVEEFKKSPEKYIQILENWKKVITKKEIKTNDNSIKC